MSEPPTLREYNKLDLKRPYTDSPIGGTTGTKRGIDAALSALHTPPENPYTERSNPDDSYLKERRPTAECGTQSGYKRHRRLKEDSCDLCRQANAERKAKAKAKAKKKAQNRA